MTTHDKVMMNLIVLWRLPNRNRKPRFFWSEPWRIEIEVFWSQVKIVLPSDVCIYIVSNSMNRRTDKRTNTDGNNIHRNSRCHAVSTSDVVATCGLCQEKRTDKRESNLVHFNLKMWHLVAKMLTNFLMINWPNFVYLLVDQGLYPPC